MTGPDGRGGHFRSIPVASVIARKKKRVRTRIALRLSLVGEDGFEPSKHDATDLQSAPFGHSGILPYWSWWTDLNPRHADYKSAALPTELHQRICYDCDYITNRRMCQRLDT